jgi:hypothetical protein
MGHTEPPPDLILLDAMRIDWNTVRPASADALLEYLKYNPDSRPEDLNKALPKNPKVLEMLLTDPRLDTAARAKVLEVALLRGGSTSYARLKSGWIDEGSTLSSPVGFNPGRAKEMLAYQNMAILAATGDDRALLPQLSRSGDHLPPDYRQPATQLMHIMLQKGGHYKDANSVEDWILSLRPEDRGRAIYHLRDAAANKDLAGGWKLESMSGEGRIGIFTAGGTYRYQDTHWEKTVQNIEGKVRSKLTEDTIKEYNDGMEFAKKDKPEPADKPPPFPSGAK